jgi:hypothetical protein
MLENKQIIVFIYFILISAFFYFYPQYLNIKDTTAGISNTIIILFFILIASTLSYLLYFFYSFSSFKK